MNLNIKTRYSKSNDYEYSTVLERLNLDDEKYKDILSGNGFVVSAAKAIKDEIKAPDGIFSTKFGPGLQDVNAFANKYRCQCGHTTSRFYHGLNCEVCGTKVEYKDDNFDMFGYVCLKDPYHIIHPNLFMTLAFFIGEKEFMSIITPSDEKDEDGHDVIPKRSKDKPYEGIGLMEFYDKFDEIVEFYKQKRPAKKDYYDEIMRNRDKIFIQSIPVYTIHLRPYRLDNGVLHYEGTNATYKMISKYASIINNDKTNMNKEKKPKNQLLFNLQMKYRELYNELTDIISGKKGSRDVWTPIAKSIVKNLLNCWKAKGEILCQSAAKCQEIQWRNKKK